MQAGAAKAAAMAPMTGVTTIEEESAEDPEAEGEAVAEEQCAPSWPSPCIPMHAVQHAGCMDIMCHAVMVGGRSAGGPHPAVSNEACV